MSKKQRRSDIHKTSKPLDDTEKRILLLQKEFGRQSKEMVAELRSQILEEPDGIQILRQLGDRRERGNKWKPQYDWERARDLALAEMGPPEDWQAPAKRQLCEIMVRHLQDPKTGRPDRSTVRRKVNDHPMFDDFHAAAEVADKQ